MFAVSRMVFVIAFFNLRRRNNAIYRQKNRINNNILRVVDPTGCELIVTGRGLGFGVKPGYKIEAETVERSYRMTSPAVQQKLVELLEQIPYEHLLLTDELVAMIRSRGELPR